MIKLSWCVTEHKVLFFNANPKCACHADPGPIGTTHLKFITLEQWPHHTGLYSPDTLHACWKHQWPEPLWLRFTSSWAINLAPLAPVVISAFTLIPGLSIAAAPTVITWLAPTVIKSWDVTNIIREKKPRKDVKTYCLALCNQKEQHDWCCAGMGRLQFKSDIFVLKAISIHISTMLQTI